MATWKKVITTSDDSTYANERITLAQLDAGLDGESGYGANKILKVNSNGDAIIWAEDSGITTLASLTDTNISSASTGQIIVHDGTDSFDNVSVTGDVALASNGAVTINDDAVTYAKMQDIATANRVLGATLAGAVSEVQVQTAMIADDAVDGNKLADNIVIAGNLDMGGTLDVTGNAQFDANVDIDGNVIIDGNLDIKGSTTTISTTELEVEDKAVRLGAPDSAYANDASANTGAHGGGIILESSTGTVDTAFARITWNKNGEQSGWEIADTGTSNGQSTAYPIATMSYSDDSTAPSADLNGVGGLHFDTGSDTLYVRVS